MTFKKIRGKLLIVSGIVLAIVMVWISISLVSFLVTVLNESLTLQRPAVRASEFDTQSFDALSLMQEKSSGGSVPVLVPPKVPTTSTSTTTTSTAPKTQ